MENQATIIKNYYRERKRLEMKRRMGVLHHRRACLEQELNNIKVALISMDRQMQKDKAYEQLSL
tara:strand:- start:5872 stop:6063 length:192 start_codon:yes stop_codon:yes gene_type:complete